MSQQLTQLTSFFVANLVVKYPKSYKYFSKLEAALLNISLVSKLTNINVNFISLIK